MKSDVFGADLPTLVQPSINRLKSNDLSVLSELFPLRKIPIIATDSFVIYHRAAIDKLICLGPLLLCGCTCLLLLIMSTHAYLSSKHSDMKRNKTSYLQNANKYKDIEAKFFSFTLVCILQV